LLWLKDIQENEAPRAYATTPHILGRTIDVLDILTNCQIIIHACLARKASNKYFDFRRLDFPEMDPPDWHKWIKVRQENGEMKVGEMPIDFAGNLVENYKAHNKDYHGWYDSQK
jgi:succinate dehydrogenase/fumarate reductase flavoprotein subunit